MFFIYKITNKINGKIYIGKTCRDIQTRWREHKSRANQKEKFYLHNAIHKYGPENFSIEEIDKTENIEEINILEQKWINYYNSTDKNKGYNLTNGGDGIQKYNWDEFRKLWDEGYSVKEISKIYNCYRGTVGDALKNYSNYSYSESLSRSSYSKKQIDKYDKNKNFLKAYSSIKEAAEEIGCSPNTIAKCIRLKKYSALGFYWIPHGEKLPDDINFIKTNKKHKINQYDLQGKFLKTFNSAAEAAREVNPNGNVNSSSSSILQVCKGNQKTAYGFIWKKEEDAMQNFFNSEMI